MSKSYEVIQPRNTLREKLGGQAPVLDAAALARAEEALRSLSGQFQGWIEDDVNKLDAARRRAVQARFSHDTVEDLFARAHDVKGMGSTYDYPLVTRIAASLCKLLETPEIRAIAVTSPGLIEAHVDALKAAVRGQIRSDTDPIGAALAGELEAKVRALISAASAKTP